MKAMVLTEFHWRTSSTKASRSDNNNYDDYNYNKVNTQVHSSSHNLPFVNSQIEIVCMDTERK